MNIFEAAVRQKLRFGTIKGLLSVEDLWDLPLTSATGKMCLDGIALDLHKRLREAADVVSFVDNKAPTDSFVQLQFDLVKHIIDVRKRENADAAKERDRAALKQQILAALARKRENALESASEEDLQKRLAEL